MLTIYTSFLLIDLPHIVLGFILNLFSFIIHISYYLFLLFFILLQFTFKLLYSIFIILNSFFIYIVLNSIKIFNDCMDICNLLQMFFKEFFLFFILQ